ncbi:hypothetical protein P0082_07540 [Candidatus Haliotispira prima]|uniref:Uncharacterized protein n=1 Tax=Candidatus Haliotispira prima TaxID=3034016 RepID=A0ABY8MGM6_9SPIO|nr:hypothetical protein P0082_07540 [Candidatus Haliotispira prima]
MTLLARNFAKQQPINNLQITDSVIFWLEPVQQIPKPNANENLNSEDYRFEVDCSTNGYRTQTASQRQIPE